MQRVHRSNAMLVFTASLALLLPAFPASGTETPFITVSQAQAKPGQFVTISGSGFSSESVILRLIPTGVTHDGFNVTPTSGCHVSDGAFACVFMVPSSSVMYGTPGKLPIPKVDGESNWTIKAIGGGGEIATAPFDIGAVISLSPPSGPPGTVVKITGTGFQPFDAYVQVLLAYGVVTERRGAVLTEGSYVSSCIPNTKGDVSCSVTIPPRPPGTYTLCLCANLWSGGDDTASAIFTVTPPSLILSAVSGPPGATITAIGSGYAVNAASLHLYLDGFDHTEVTPSAGCPLNEGLFSCSITIPDVSPGQFSVRANSHDAAGFPLDVAIVAFTVIYQPVVTVVPSTGPPGTIVHVQGSGFSDADTAVSLIWGEPSSRMSLKDCPAAHGAFSCTVAVPSGLTGAEGPRMVEAWGNTAYHLGNQASAHFTLIASPSVVLNPTSGPPGTVVTVTGTHFLASDTSATLTFGADELNVTPATGCSVSNRTFSCSFVVPSVGPGCYAVAATGNAGDRGTATFTVPPLCLTVTPSSARVSTQVTAIGNGFKSSDTSVLLSLNGADVTPPSGCPLSAGSLNCLFTVPVVPAGRHILTATSNSGDLTRGTLTVVPGMTLSPSSGFGRSSVLVTGSGLPSGEPDLQIFFGDTDVTPTAGCPVTDGTFACTITVPPRIPGAYSIALSGSSGLSAVYTIETCTGGLSVTSVCLTLNPSSGYAGASITVSGTGFSNAAQFATLTFGGIDVTPASGCPILGGSFLCVITPPPGSPGNWGVTAVGNPDGYTRQDVQTVLFRIVPTMSLTPSSGPPATRVTINGGNFASIDTMVFLQLQTTAVGGVQRGLGSCPLSNGSLSCIVDIPQVPKGTYQITARPDKSSQIGSSVFIVGPQIFSSASKAEPGGLVTITGVGFSSSDSTVTLSLGELDVTPASGCGLTDNRFSCVVTVPSSPPGCYTLTATGTTGDTASLQLQVGSLCVFLNPDQGPTGTVVTVTGTGFGGTDTSAVLTFGGEDVTPTAGCPITNGSFSCALTVPPAAVGVHQIAARGTGGTTNSAPFLVNAGITISPSAGPPGTKVTIAGSGFPDADLAFRVDFDLFPHGRIPFNQNNCPLVDGAGSCTFTIPVVPGRHYTVQAIGIHTQQAHNTSFTVTAAIQLSPASGPPGTSVTVTGSGFPDSDTSNLMRFPPVLDQHCPVSGGNLSCTFNVPHLPAGTWSVDVISQSTNVAFSVRAPFLIGPLVQLGADAAAPGAQVAITGSGLSPADTSVTFRAGFINLTSPGGCPVSQRAFGCSFIVPTLLPGPLTITATGNSGASATAGFNVVWGPPVIATPLSGESMLGTNVVISGTGVPHAIVDVFEGAALLGSARVGPSAVFSMTASISHGVRTLTAVQHVGGDVCLVSPQVCASFERGPTSAPVVLTILNPVPILTAAPGQSADEGANAAFALGSFTDDDASSPWTIEVTWGDGSVASNLVRTTVGELPATEHTYTDNGSYTVTVRVTSKHGGAASVNFQVDVANVAPLASLGHNGPVAEKSAATISFNGPSDPSSGDVAAGFHYAYACDGGSLAGASYAASGSEPTVSCSFDEGPATHTVRARIIDKDGGFNEYTTAVDVNNANPTAILANTGPADEGSTVTIRFSDQRDPSDADIAAGFHYAYACDGGSLAGATYAASGSDPTGACAFDDGPSTRTVRAWIIDKDGGFSEYTTDVSVLNVAPAVVSLGADPLLVDEASPTLLSLTFTDPGLGDMHAADWTFGDGTTLTDAIEASRRDSRMQHTYGDNGTYRARLVITDDDGAEASREIDVEVRNVMPAFVIAPQDRSTAERQTLTFEITGRDVATVDMLTLTLDGLPAGAEYTSDPATGDVRGVFTWTPACNQSGEYPLTFTLRDDDHGASMASMIITVSEACRGVVAVTNRNGAFDGVTFIDAERNEPVVTVDVAHQPLGGLAFHDLTFDAGLDAAKLYVNQQGPGSASVLIQPRGAAGDAAFAFVPILEVPVGNQPAGVAVTPDGAEVWTADRAGDSISILDRAADAVIARVPVKKAGLKPEAIAFSKDGRYAYVAARNSNNVLVVDRAVAVSSPELSIVASVAVGEHPTAALVDPSGGLLLVATADGVEVLSLASPGSPALIARASTASAGGLAIAAGKLYATDPSNDTVEVFAVASAEPYLVLVATIPVGREPGAIAAVPHDALFSEPRLYVANRKDDSLSVIDAVTDAVVATVAVGKHPAAVAAGIMPSK